MKKKENPKNKRPQQSDNSMPAQMQASVEIRSSASISYRYSEREYERLFIREPEVETCEGKVAYVCPKYHKCIMHITRVIGHDSPSLSTYIDRILTQYFNQREEAIRSLYVRNYNSIS